ncbi:MAG: hypothetical protein M3378_03865 [Actinomycetota bacterium]|nr:hypothetical protein [Actinomycetota bacterium]MDQ3679675.1 hypothetical protein [Actinomycetota bacterium]
MTLIDTSAWVEFLRDTGSPVCAAVDALLGDCLIAAVAIGAGVPLLHADADFEVLARHTELQVA